MVQDYKEICRFAENHRETYRHGVEYEMRVFNTFVEQAYLSGQEGVYITWRMYHCLKHDLRASGYKINSWRQMFNRMVFIRLPRSVKELCYV